MAQQPNKSGKSVPRTDNNQAAELGRRIAVAIERIGSLVKAGAVAGVTDEAVARWRDGLSRAPFDGIVQLCQASGLSIEWMATGKGPRDSAAMTNHDAPGLDDREDLAMQIQDSAALAGNSMVMLPRLDVEAAAGAGAVVASEYVAEMIAFSAAWLRERHITPRTARILTARGDSMEPTIRDGDLLIVDTSIETAVDNGIYCIAYDGVLLVKRLFMIRNGGLIISSDNKIAGRDEEIGPHDVPEVDIKGRVMWYGRTI